MAPGDGRIPQELHRGALEGAAEERNNTQDAAGDAQRQMASAPSIRGVLLGEETAVEEEDGELDASDADGPEEFECVLDLR